MTEVIDMADPVVYACGYNSHKIWQIQCYACGYNSHKIHDTI